MKRLLDRRRSVAWLASGLVLAVLAACRTTSNAKDGATPEKTGEDRRY